MSDNRQNETNFQFFFIHLNKAAYKFRDQFTTWKYNYFFSLNFFFFRIPFLFYFHLDDEREREWKKTHTMMIWIMVRAVRHGTLNSFFVIFQLDPLSSAGHRLFKLFSLHKPIQIQIIDGRNKAKRDLRRFAVPCCVYSVRFMCWKSFTFQI